MIMSRCRASELRHAPWLGVEVPGSGLSLMLSSLARVGRSARAVAGNSIIRWAALLCVLLPTGKAPAMTLEELAEICAAWETAIEDVYAEYDWDREPAYTTMDITEQVVAVPTGPRKFTWATARPFADRSLFVESTEWVDAGNHPFHITETRSYSGETGKRLQMRRDVAQGQPSADGTITKSRRFVPPGSITPRRFTILRFHEERPDYPLSEALRKAEWVDMSADIQQIGSFRTIRVDFYAEGFRDKQGDRVPLSRMYFSVDHGYAPVQFELLNFRKIITRDVVTELEEVAPGIWYPKEACATEFGQDGTEHTFTYRASKVVVNQGLSQDFFDIDFPPGTRVSDEILDSEYYIRPTEEQFDQWLETQEILDKYRSKLTGSESTARPAPPSLDNTADPTGTAAVPEENTAASGQIADYAFNNSGQGLGRVLAVAIKPFLLGLSLMTAVVLGLCRWLRRGNAKAGDLE